MIDSYLPLNHEQRHHNILIDAKLQINEEYSRFPARLCLSAGDSLFFLQYTAG